MTCAMNMSPPSSVRTLWVLMSRELREAVWSRWFVLFAVSFTALGLCVSYVSATSLGGVGLAGFGRTSAGLINLVLLVVPLMALTTGASSVAGDRERGTLAFLVAQPVKRWEVLLGKFIALGLALAAAICTGFGLSAGVLMLQNGTSAPGPFVHLAILSIQLALAMLAVGLLISVTTRRQHVATGLAVFVWLALVFGTDLGLMAGTLGMNLSIEWLFRLAAMSPLQAFKMASLQSVDATVDVLGPAGLYAQTEYGPRLSVMLSAVLALWTVVPLAVSIFVFGKRSPL